MEMATVQRVDILPAECPSCSAVMDAKPGAGHSRWHHYRAIPGAPAAGCGACGKLVYLTEAGYGRARQVALELQRKADELSARQRGKSRRKKRA